MLLSSIEGMRKNADFAKHLPTTMLTHAQSSRLALYLFHFACRLSGKFHSQRAVFSLTIRNYTGRYRKHTKFLPMEIKSIKDFLYWQLLIFNNLRSLNSLLVSGGPWFSSTGFCIVGKRQKARIKNPDEHDPGCGFNLIIQISHFEGVQVPFSTAKKLLASE